MNRRRTLCAVTPPIYVMAVAVVMSLTSSRDVLSQVHSKPVTDSTVLYELEGYTVLPPPGKNWFEMRRDRRQALFGKKIESPTHSFAAAAVSATLGQKFENRTEFEAYVRNLKAQDVDSARYRLVEYVAEPENALRRVVRPLSDHCAGSPGAIRTGNGAASGARRHRMRASGQDRPYCRCRFFRARTTCGIQFGVAQ